MEPVEGILGSLELVPFSRQAPPRVRGGACALVSLDTASLEGHGELSQDLTTILLRETRQKTRRLR